MCLQEAGSWIWLNKARMLNTKKCFLDPFIFSLSFLVEFFPEQDSIQTVFPFLQSHCYCGFLGQQAYPSKYKHSKIQDSPASWLPIASGKQSSQEGRDNWLPSADAHFAPADPSGRSTALLTHRHRFPTSLLMGALAASEEASKGNCNIITKYQYYPTFTNSLCASLTYLNSYIIQPVIICFSGSVLTWQSSIMKAS